MRKTESDNVVDSDGEGNDFAEWLKTASLRQWPLNWDLNREKKAASEDLGEEYWKEKEWQSPWDRIQLVHPEMSKEASVAEAQQERGKGVSDRLAREGLAGHTKELIFVF